MSPTNVAQCKNCNQPIVWMVTKNAKNIPVDVDSVNDDEYQEAVCGEKVLYVYGEHVCHFETCKDAK